MRGELPDGRSFELSPGTPAFGEERIAVIEADGGREEMALHDYDRVYAVPGLYEAVVQDALRCLSPAETGRRAEEAVRALGLEPEEMRVLDVGAGNGVVGTELAERGFRHVFGTDLEPEAEAAARRDRPGVYDRYVAGDLADAGGTLLAAIAEWEPNAMTAAGALGGGHMGALALANAFDALSQPAISVLTVAEARLEATAEEGLGALVAERVAAGTMEELGRERFRHRLSMAGEPVYYYAIALRGIA